ncbi:isocitrate/isopropylmalate family dehydrogenase [Corynebacterium hansenii]|uniref:Isocitrate/isopropylmalate family dehydrogenase n=1 Tax=Corynebacterium hansenii TaxID=394964 RepID=A0ABV7ZMU2_9CORY|nr:isocitrate/isopropylmalate family dehydrogenase [Corynebacterium hansenii]
MSPDDDRRTADSPAPEHAPGPNHRIVLLPGDGIGPEIVDASRPALSAAFPTWEFADAEIGWRCWCEGGDPVPAETWRALESADAALMAAITSKPAREADAELAAHLRGTGLTYRSPVLQLRSRLDLFANVRPVEDLLADSPRFRFTVVRENTEGLYSHDFSMRDADAPAADGPGAHPTGRPAAGIWDVVKRDPTVSRSTPADTAVALRVTTGFAWRRLLRTAAALTGRAAAPALRRVTVADKPNILRESGAIIRDAVDEVAGEFPGVEFEIANADAVAMRMVTAPESFDVIAAENLLGDMLSDLGAGLMGGLGLPSSGNIGADHAVFEPVHGSAPDIAGRGVANPAAFLLSAAMCAEHLAGAGDGGDAASAGGATGAGSAASDLAGAGGEGDAAGTGGEAGDLGERGRRLRRAVIAVLREHPTPDLGGDNTTAGFADEVAARLASSSI